MCFVLNTDISISTIAQKIVLLKITSQAGVCFVTGAADLLVFRFISGA